MIARTSRPVAQVSRACAGHRKRRELNRMARLCVRRGRRVEGAASGKCLAAMVVDDANAETPLTRVTFLLNFSDEPRRKAPTGK